MVELPSLLDALKLSSRSCFPPEIFQLFHRQSIQYPNSHFLDFITTTIISNPLQPVTQAGSPEADPEVKIGVETIYLGNASPGEAPKGVGKQGWEG